MAPRVIVLTSILLCLGCIETSMRRGYSDPPPPSPFLQSGETVVVTDTAIRHAWSLNDHPYVAEKQKLLIPQLKIKDLWEALHEKFEVRKAFQGDDVVRDGDLIEVAGGHGSSFLSSRLTGASADHGQFRLLKDPQPQAGPPSAIRYGDAFVIRGDRGYFAQPENVPILNGAYMQFVPDRSSATSFTAFRNIRAALDAAGKIRTAVRIHWGRDWLFGAALLESHRSCSTELVNQEQPGPVRFHWLFEDTLRVTMDKKVEVATFVVYWIPRTWTAEQSAEAGCSRQPLQPERR
jgi:hypothetical protein